MNQNHTRDTHIGDTLLFATTVLLIGSIVRIGASIYLPAMSIIQKEFHISSSMMSNTLSIYFTIFSIFTIIAGILSDTYGRKPILLFGMIFFILGSIFCGFSENYSTLIVGRATQALGASMIPGTLMAMIRDGCSDIKVVSLIGWLSVLSGLFLVASPMIGGILTHFMSWRANFWFLVFFTSIVFVITIFKVPETHIKHTNRLSNLKSILTLTMHIFVSPRFIYIMLPIILFFALQGAFLSSAPYIVMGKYGLSSIEFGISNIPVVIGLFCGRWLSVFIYKKYKSETKVYHFCAYGSVFVAILFLGLHFEYISGLWSFLMVSGLFALIAGTMSPIGMKSSITAFRENSGIAASLQGATLMGAAALGSFIMGFAMKIFPDASILSIFALISALLSFASIIPLLRSNPS